MVCTGDSGGPTTAMMVRYGGDDCDGCDSVGMVVVVAVIILNLIF